MEKTLIERNIAELQNDILAELRQAYPQDILEAYVSLAAKGLNRNLVEAVRFNVIAAYLRDVLYSRPHIDNTCTAKVNQGRETVGDIRASLLICSNMVHRLALLHQNHPLNDELRDIEKQLDIIRGRLYKIQ